MAIFFILFLVVIFICVMVIKSSMNYEFGSDRKRTTIRLSVVAATLAAVIVHSALATILLNLIWTGPTRDDPAAGLVILFLAVTPGTLIWGFTVPKVVFSFVGKKPIDADTQHYDVNDSVPSHEVGAFPQPTQTNEKPAYPWEEQPPKKSKKPLLIGAGTLALLATAAAVYTTFMLTGGPSAQATPGVCDTWLRQQLVHAPRATASADNANLVVAYVQSQRPEHCPPGDWNPLVTDIARHSDRNITVSFSTTTGNARGTTVTLPSDGALYWEYDDNEQKWNAPPELTYQPPEPTPTNAVRVTRQPATTGFGQSNPSPTNAPTMVPTLPPDSFVEIGNSEWFNQQAWTAYERGEGLLDAGDYHAAITAFQSAKAYHGKPSSVLENNIGVAFQAMGNHERAIDHFSKAIEIEDGPTDRVNRAYSYFETEQCPLAIHDAQQALEMKTHSTKGFHTDAEAHATLGSCQTQSGDHDQAVIHLRAALTLMRANDYSNGELAMALSAIGNVLYLEGQHIQAVEHLSQAIALDDVAIARVGRAAAHAAMQDCANASADSRAALRLPTSHWHGYHSGAEAHYTLSHCLWDAGSLHEALQHSEQALALMRENRYEPELIAEVEAEIRFMREHIDSSQPTSANANDPDYAAFAAQRTRIAPTKAAFISQTLASADETMDQGQHRQWGLLTIKPTDEQRAQTGYSRSKMVRDGNGQQYTCVIYEDGSQVPRVNLAFHKELNYTVTRNQYDELQGNIVHATTTIGKAVAPVDWRTWASRTDRIRLRGADATSFVRMLEEQGTDEFRLDLPENPELSSTYDVSNLLAAMEANGMTCFESQ